MSSFAYKPTVIVVEQNSINNEEEGDDCNEGSSQLPGDITNVKEKEVVQNTDRISSTNRRHSFATIDFKDNCPRVVVCNDEDNSNGYSKHNPILIAFKIT